MIIITGASKGIGSYLLDRFKEERLPAIGTYNSSIINKTDRAESFQLDITNYESINRFVETIEDKLNNIILINCAGIAYSSFAHKADIKKWHRVIEVNLIGTFNVIHRFLPYMRRQKFGRIIIFSSVVTALPTNGVSAYSASKSGLNGLTKSLSIENASLGITVNAINLGYSNIGMGIKNLTPDFKEKINKQIPAGRFCEPNEIYNTVKYLIDTEYVNGSIININGGLI